MSTSTITEATRPRLRIQFKLARGLFNKPFKAIVSILSLAALSALHGSLLTLIGYAIKPSDWIDNRDAAYIGCIAGCCLLPFTAAVFVGFLSEFEGICVMSEVAREKWLRNAVTGVNETKDWATLQAGDKKPPNSGKEPQYSGWLALIPMGLFHIPVLTLFGTICGTVGAPITHIDTARASLIRTTIGGAVLGGGYLVLLIWISVFLYAIEVKLPVFEAKSLSASGKDAEAAPIYTVNPERDAQPKSRPSSIAKTSEGLARPPTPPKSGEAAGLTSSKRESMRNYLGQQSGATSYAAALAASTIGSQESSFDRPYSSLNATLNNKRETRGVGAARDSSASIPAVAPGRVLERDSLRRGSTTDSDMTLTAQEDVPAKSPGTAVV